MRAPNEVAVVWYLS